MSDQNYTLRFVDLQTGEILEDLSPRTDSGAAPAGDQVLRDALLVLNTKTASIEKNKGMAAVERWRLQSVARALLPGHRVGKCYRVMIKKVVSVFRSQESKKSFYGGLCVCGSIWACPVCASKISERRRVELEKVDTKNYFMFMVTITIQHNKNDDLQNLFTGLAESWRSVKSGRWWQEFKKENQIVGSVQGLEVTYGSGSGWHPHKHIIFFSELPFLDLQKIKNDLYKQYAKKLDTFGLYASASHGLDVVVVDKGNADYVAKFCRWGAIQEITKSSSKKGRSNGSEFRYQAFDLLASDDALLGSKFVEYVRVFKGCKQLIYSPGLRAKLGLGVVASDLELAEHQDEKSYLLATLSPADWQVILDRKKRAEVLEVANYGDLNLLNIYLIGLGCSRGGESKK